MDIKKLQPKEIDMLAIEANAQIIPTLLQEAQSEGVKQAIRGKNLELLGPLAMEISVLTENNSIPKSENIPHLRKIHSALNELLALDDANEVTVIVPEMRNNIGILLSRGESPSN